jgi:hypothetical protein
MPDMKHFIKPKIQVIPVMVRIRPQAKELLVAASRDQRRSQASIVEELIIEGLARKYSSLDVRLSAMLKGQDETTQVGTTARD